MYDLAFIHPLPASGQQVVSLSQSYCVSPVTDARGGEGDNREKAWSSVNPTVLSALPNLVLNIYGDDSR